MTDEKVSVRLVNQVSEIGRLSETVNEFGQIHHLTDEALFAINLSLEEILINVIKHGYDDTDVHEIAVRFWLSGNNFTAEIADDGVPFDPLDLPAPDITKPLEERQIGGLGVHLIRNMMDKVEYRRRGDNNILVVTKKAK